MENDSMFRNSEHYPDPTAGQAWRNIQAQEEAERLATVGNLVHALRSLAKESGFEIIGRIPLKHIKTGKEYK